MILLNIGIIDADLIGRKKHRFPNLASMKISGYHKKKKDNVTLLLTYENLNKYDLIYISKVFTDTDIPKEVLKLPNIKYGGTGFFYDKAPNLPLEIEHHMPDYHLYDKWVNQQLNNGEDKSHFDYYLNYSIGFTTRGCFRKCSFCVNKKYNHVSIHSSLEEFLDKDRKYICLLDDNILGYSQYEQIFNKLIETNKYFQYKQGMDERILTEDKILLLSKCKYKGDYIFAFDNIADKNLIIEKLKIWKKHIKKTTKFYVLCGYDRNNKWNQEFWKQDVIDTFERIKILMEYGCLPYIMRYNRYIESPYKGTYINLAR